MVTKNDYYKAFATWSGKTPLGKHLTSFFNVNDKELEQMNDYKKIAEKFIEKYVGEENAKSIKNGNKQQHSKSGVQ